MVIFYLVILMKCRKIHGKVEDLSLTTVPDTDEIQKEWIKSIVERMKVAYGFTSKVALSRHFDLADKAATMWIQSGTVPYQHIHTCVTDTNSSFDYILYGQGVNLRLTDEDKQRLQSNYAMILQSGQDTLLIEAKNPTGFELLSIALVEKTQKFMTDLMGIQVVEK